MSDMSQGPGWWIASDGQWYPPHLHPSVRIDPPAPAVDTAGDPSPETQAAPTASAVPPRYIGSAAFSTPDSSVAPHSTVTPHSTGGSDGTFGPVPDVSSAAGPSGKRSRTPVAAGLSVLVVLLLVAGAFVIFGGSRSASAEVIDAVNSTLGDKTAQISMNETITTAGKTLTATGTGAMDFTHEALQVNLNASLDGQQVPIEADYVAGVIYEQIPGLDQILPGKSWISLDLSSLQNASASSQDPSAQNVGANPSVILRALAQQGNSVVALGPSTLDGVAVNGYAVKMNAAAVSQQLKKANLPAWIRQSLVGLKTHDINLKVYVDNSDLLRSFQFQTTESKGSSGPIDISETLDFSHYGTPVSVTVPPADQVASFQQLLQAEQAQTTPAT